MSWWEELNRAAIGLLAPGWTLAPRRWVKAGALAGALARCCGITEADVRRSRPCYHLFAYEVQAWNGQRYIVSAYDFVKATRVEVGR